MQVFDTRKCALGEGPLWHPERGELFWFDILGKRLMAEGKAWDFDEHVSAAGWLDETRLLVASETGLMTLDLGTDAREEIAPLEAENPITRSNDGRADPYGGFWIGTMGKALERGAGAIYRYYRGEVRCLHQGISIPNSICFSPDGLWAYFTDTPTRRIMRQPLETTQGWPNGEPEVFADLRADGVNPDGSVADAEGRIWNAQWGAGRVACYTPEGLAGTVPLAASQATCPAFGGEGLRTLFCTSAADGVSEPEGGMTFMTNADATGQAEHRVIL